MKMVTVIESIVVAGFMTLFLLMFYPYIINNIVTPVYNVYIGLIPDPRPEMSFWWKFLPLFLLFCIIWGGITYVLDKINSRGDGGGED
jgi:hypothetical protein